MTTPKQEGEGAGERRTDFLAAPPRTALELTRRGPDETTRVGAAMKSSGSATGDHPPAATPQRFEAAGRGFESLRAHHPARRAGRAPRRPVRPPAPPSARRAARVPPGAPSGSSHRTCATEARQAAGSAFGSPCGSSPSGRTLGRGTPSRHWVYGVPIKGGASLTPRCDRTTLLLQGPWPHRQLPSSCAESCSAVPGAL